jgi:hypothetical protein
MCESGHSLTIASFGICESSRGLAITSLNIHLELLELDGLMLKTGLRGAGASRCDRHARFARYGSRARRSTRLLLNPNLCSSFQVRDDLLVSPRRFTTSGREIATTLDT